MAGEDYDDNIISEGAEYSPKSEFSKARVVEEAIKRCITERSKEMIEGYYNYKFDDKGMPLKIWIPDQREVFHSCIKALRNLLSPEIKKNNKYKETEKVIDDEKKILFLKYCYEELELAVDKNGKNVYKASGNKYIPKKGERVLVKQISQDGRIVARELVNGWDRKVDFYLDEILNINDRLFAALNELIDGLNYFKQQIRF